jgi:glyoxylase-like metal-dependent hydrolase (beta-lactamase superfamily II)
VGYLCSRDEPKRIGDRSAPHLVEAFVDTVRARDARLAYVLDTPTHADHLSARGAPRS